MYGLFLPPNGVWAVVVQSYCGELHAVVRQTPVCARYNREYYEYYGYCAATGRRTSQTRLRYATPWQAILRAAGEFYKERAEGSGFVTLRRDKAYLRTRSEAPGNNAMASNIASSWRVLQGKSRPRLRGTTPWQAILRAAGEFWQADP